MHKPQATKDLIPNPFPWILYLTGRAKANRKGGAGQKVNYDFKCFVLEGTSKRLDPLSFLLCSLYLLVDARKTHADMDGS